jgi:hypothetical protein
VKEIKVDKDGVPVWTERFGWWVEARWWDLIDCFDEMWKAIVDLITNPLWWTIVGIVSLPLLFMLLGGK